MKQETEKKERGRYPVDAQTAELAARLCVRMLLTAAVSGAVVLEEAAPFGVAMTAASGGGALGAAALLGACLGSLCCLELTVGLRWAAAAMLTYAAAFALYDIKWMRRPWTMPAAAGAAVLFTGLAAHIRYPWTMGEQIILFGETLLAVGAVFGFRAALRLPGLHPRREENERPHRGGVLVLLTVLLMALAPPMIGELSLGRCVGGLLVIWAASLGGGPTGTVWGVALGTGLDLAGSGQALRAVVWPLAGLAAGSRGAGGRLRAVVLWMGAVILCPLLLGEPEAAMLCAAEGMISALLFLLLPRSWLRRGERLVEVQSGGVLDPDGVSAVRERLRGAARAYHTLCNTLKTSLRPPENDGDVSMVFDRAASRVCRVCRSNDLCWQKDYASTFTAFNDATAAMVERGRALPEDFPSYFSNRCIKLPDFLAAVNEELTALFYRRRYMARVRDSREAVCDQYDQLSRLLYETAEELDRELLPAEDTRRTVERYANKKGLNVEISAFRDGRGLLRLRVHGPDYGAFSREKELEALSRHLGKSFRAEHMADNVTALVEQEPFKAVAGVASRKKDGETVSGDAGTYFKKEDGTVCLLLCDGMGSGEQANRESSLAIRLLEEFLRTGIPADQVLLTLASALALRGDETGGFTTVDLLEVDLFTGESVLYKLGAAPSYVRQGESVRCLSGKSLPAGLAEGKEGAVDRFTLRLAPGDHVLMVSDGVCTGEEDGWLVERLREFDGDSPRQLAARLVAESPQGATDDRTALVVRLERR